jgi:ERCC4-related helicase
VSKLENKLNQTIVSYEKALADSKIRHAKDVERVKGELNNIHKDELKRVKEQLKEEQLTRMEHEVSKNEAVLAMERATEKAASSERKLQEMLNFIKEAESLKVSNDKLHLSLQEETEKRKILHNTLEDMKVSGAVRCSCIAFRVLYIL